MNDQPADNRRLGPRIIRVLIWLVSASFAAVVLLLMVAAGGCQTPFRDREISNRKPFADFIGREYRVGPFIEAHAWNDFPDKSKILGISLMPSPGVNNRFVSYKVPLKPGQVIRIMSAWQNFNLEFSKHYIVSVPGAGLPENVPVTLRVGSNGVPDPTHYEPITR